MGLLETAEQGCSVPDGLAIALRCRQWLPRIAGLTVEELALGTVQFDRFPGFHR